MRASSRAFLLIGSAFLWTACASVKPPSVRVAGIHLDGVSLTGARVDVGLQIRNVNPEDLQIERFDYEVKLNGKVLGHGFQADPLMLAGFKEDRVVSRLDIGWTPKSRGLSTSGTAPDSAKSSSAVAGTST
jgi:LEA14-like dessication related protein